MVAALIFFGILYAILGGLLISQAIDRRAWLRATVDAALETYGGDVRDWPEEARQALLRLRKTPPGLRGGLPPLPRRPVRPP